MFDDKINVKLDEYEQNILINALNDMRTNLIKEERFTDAVDDLLIKIAEASSKRAKVAERSYHDVR